MNSGFWQNKRVLLTGHTGFKGAWLGLCLEHMGARVTGYSLAPATDPALYDILKPWPSLTSITGDVRDRRTLREAVSACKPEIVFHLAAQALVRFSYADPVETFDTNAMGTVYLLDVLRDAPDVATVLVVTSDKVYAQDGRGRPHEENDRLGGTDPYSASKATQEIIAASYAASFFTDRRVPVATARAGNVIGGGDWAADRLVPDFFRSIEAGERFQLRYPMATRPWQHVLEPLAGYLTYAEKLTAGEELPMSLNFGPNDPPLTVAEVIAELSKLAGYDDGWHRETEEQWPEHGDLQLDSAQARTVLGWRQRLSIEESLEWTAAWYQAHAAGDNMRAFSISQVDAYMGLAS